MSKPYGGIDDWDRGTPIPDEVTVSGAFRICGAEVGAPADAPDGRAGEICIDNPGHIDPHRWTPFWREETA